MSETVTLQGFGLKIYRSQTVVQTRYTTRTLYEIWRGADPKRGEGFKEVAMLVIDSGGKTFTLQYYPYEQPDITVFKDIPLKDLKEAEDYLRGKGFE